MSNRFRNERIEIKLTKEEKELFKKIELSKSKSMEHFIRKSILEDPIFVIDMNVFRRLQTLIGRILRILKKKIMISREIIEIQNIPGRKYKNNFLQM